MEDDDCLRRDLRAAAACLIGDAEAESPRWGDVSGGVGKDGGLR